MPYDGAFSLSTIDYLLPNAMTYSQNSIMIRVHEIALKGNNRPMFMRRLETNLKLALKNFPQCNIKKTHIGVGISDVDKDSLDEVLEKIWDPFFTTGRAKGGTGLGLSIVRNLVSANLHGRAEVESTLGEGTRISLKFPCAMPPLRNGDTTETENTVLGE